MADISGIIRMIYQIFRDFFDILFNKFVFTAFGITCSLGSFFFAGTILYAIINIVIIVDNSYSSYSMNKEMGSALKPETFKKHK